MTQIFLSISGAKKYTLQNYRSGHTLDPDFRGESFSTEELVQFKRLAENHVKQCSISM